MTVEIVDVILHERRRNVGILDPLQWHARCGRFLVPDLKVLSPLLSLLSLLFLCLSRDEDLLVVKFAERGR